MRILSLVLFLVWGLVAACAVSASELRGTARAIDGDTLRIGDARIRLHGIDAPETDQLCQTEQGADWACGEWVTSVVKDRLDGETVRCQLLDKDRYGRHVGKCFLNDVDIAEWLVGDGLAFAYRRYSMDYDLTEKGAVVHDVGLHAMRVQSPAQFRRARAQVQTPLPPDGGCRIKGNISSKGARIYHMPGQRDYDRTSIRRDKGERWFCSEAEAQNAGWRRARR